MDLLPPETAATSSLWRSVTFVNNVLVAVSYSGTGNRVMTSPDGVTWTSRSAADVGWCSVTFGNNLFLAISYSGTGNRVMTIDEVLRGDMASVVGADHDVFFLCKGV